MAPIPGGDSPVPLLPSTCSSTFFFFIPPCQARCSPTSSLCLPFNLSGPTSFKPSRPPHARCLGIHGQVVHPPSEFTWGTNRSAFWNYSHTTLKMVRHATWGLAYLQFVTGRVHQFLRLISSRAEQRLTEISLDPLSLEDDYYEGPSKGNETPCACSTVTWSLFAACGICQDGKAIPCVIGFRSL